MVDHKEILRLKALGYSNVQIAEGCGCGRNTVTRTLQQAHNKGVTWDDIQHLTTQDVTAVLYPRSSARPAFQMPDYVQILQEIHVNNTSILRAWSVYYEQCIADGQIPYQRSQFYKHFESFQQTLFAEHPNEFPGDVMQSGWLPLKTALICPSTGELVPVWLFLAVLPYSGFAYSEVFPDRSTKAWLLAHANTYTHYSGVTRYLEVKDNKSCENRMKQELAKHYGTSIRKASSASCENSVQFRTIGKYLTHMIERKQYYSIDELNESIWDMLDSYHHTIEAGRKSNPVTEFAMERMFLVPIPETAFEIAQWKQATVQFNCHINVENQNYSVPYHYLQQKVDVKITSLRVEVYASEVQIATHPKLMGRLNQYSTDVSHMPPNESAEHLRWNRKRFIQWAEEIGPATAKVIRNYLAMYSVEQQSYKSCMALLTLANKHPNGAVESACERALVSNSKPSLKMVQSYL